MKNKKIIKNVPYSSQRYPSGCHYGAITMLVKFHGINTTIAEIMHHSGVAHSIISKPIHILPFTPFLPVFIPALIPLVDTGIGASQGKEDLKFLSNLYGLECRCEDSSLGITSHPDDCWIDYWRRVKHYINLNIPVYTGVNCLVWPLYMDIWDVHTTVNLLRCGHAIVIVGYDEEKNVVYFNDPYDCKLNEEEKLRKCCYAPISLDIFKNAVKKSYFALQKFNYHTVVFEKISQPFSKEEQFEMVYKRNIERMKGTPSYYDHVTCQEKFQYFGIEALKQYRTDIQKMNDDWKKIFYKFIAFFRYPAFPFGDMFILSEVQYYLRYDIAKYLYDQKAVFGKNRTAALQLQTEANLWKAHAYLWTKLNTFIKTSKIKNIVEEAPFIINKLVESIDDIIDLEQKIVGSS